MYSEEQTADAAIPIRMEFRMKKMRTVKIILSLFLVLAMMILTPAGALPAFAEESSEGATPPPEITEDGHIDAERLKQWVEDYLKTDHWDEPQCSMSIGLWYSGTDESWFYNPDEWMYGVNWSKLPISMVFAEKLANGELSNDSVITGLQLEYALQTVLENSSGSSFYSMVTYLDGNTVSNCAELVPQYAGLPDSYYTDEFYQQSYYTARIMMEVTKTLYQGGDERFPKVLEYMKKSQPWDMFNRDDYIRDVLHTSQTHAASWGDGAGDYIHCTGVIYTPTPIVLTVMMKNISDLDIMGGVAHHMAVLGVELDAKQKELRAEEETAVLAPSDTEAEESLDSSPAPDIPPATQPADSPLNADEREEPAGIDSPAQEAVSDDTVTQTSRIWVLAVSALVLLLLIGIAVLLNVKKRSYQRRKRNR